MKKIVAPDVTPSNLIMGDLEKFFDINPISITLPQVNKIVEWKPKNISVKIKDKTTIGINFTPNKNGI